jgi:hypothetical protein
LGLGAGLAAATPVHASAQQAIANTAMRFIASSSSRSWTGTPRGVGDAIAALCAAFRLLTTSGALLHQRRLVVNCDSGYVGTAVAMANRLPGFQTT